MDREETDRMNQLAFHLIARPREVGGEHRGIVYDDRRTDGGALRVRIVRDREESDPLGASVWDCCYVIRPGASPDHWESVGNRFGLQKAIMEFYDEVDAR